MAEEIIRKKISEYPEETGSLKGFYTIGYKEPEEGESPETKKVNLGKIIDHPFLSLERLRDYLYKVSFDRLPLDKGDNSPISGACSSFVRNGKLYRNLDWNYDNTASFLVVTRDFEGMAFINGLDEGSMNDDLIGQLPYRVVDGRNKHGIMVSTHVLFNDWEWTGTGEKNILLTRLPFIVLSRVKSMDTIGQDLEDVLDNLYVPEALSELGYLIQILVTDGTTSYALLPPTGDGDAYVLEDISANPKLTNFRWVDHATVARSDADLQTRPTGIERFNAIPCDLDELRFTMTYESPDRLSEFIGLRSTTKESTDAELIEIYNDAHNLFLERQRDGQTWHTMHSVVYGAQGIESLYIQENWNDNCINAGGVTSYAELPDKPSINSVELSGNKTLEDLGIQEKIEDLDNIRSGAEAGAAAYQKPAFGIPQSDIDGNFQNVLNTIGNKVNKPEEVGSQGQVLALGLAGQTVWKTIAQPSLTGAVRYDEEQTLTDTQKSNARSNIDAVGQEAGKGLSTNDFTTEEKTKLAGLKNYDDSGISGRVTAIEDKIPSQATSGNKLADKAFVNSTVQTATANFRGTWATKSAIPTDISQYPVDYTGSRKPTVNDYLVVQADESQDGGTWRYKYSGNWDTNGVSGWHAEYEVNETPLTASQLAALNSGVTAAKVALIDSAYQKPSTGIPASDLASGVIPDVSGFVTGEEMTEALAGKLDTPSDEGTEGQVLTLDENGVPTWQDAAGGEGTVRYDEELTLTDLQKAQARENIDAESPSFIAGGSDSAVTVAMDAGKTYKYMNSTGVSSLAFTLNTPSTEDRRHLWTLKFRSGATATTVTWPAGLYYPDGKIPTIEADAICEISIDEDYCVLVSTFKQATA